MPLSVHKGLTSRLYFSTNDTLYNFWTGFTCQPQMKIRKMLIGSTTSVSYYNFLFSTDQEDFEAVKHNVRLYNERAMKIEVGP